MENILSIPDGVNCTMLAPYTDKNEIDLAALGGMVDWYARKGCVSIFAMCQSTEMHMLSMEERLLIIQGVRSHTKSIEKAGGKKLPVLATGTFSDDAAEMAEQIQAVYEAGADAAVLLTNRLDPQNSGGSTLIRKAERLIGLLPEGIPLGFYECPQPYKRLLTPEELRWASASGKILFLKDTCCDPDTLQSRLDILRGTRLKLFNANAQTLLLSLRAGASGYSGVMANVHPELYARLCADYETQPEEAGRLQHILCFCAFAESLSYPLAAKYVMRKQGVPIEMNSRVRNRNEFTPYHAHIMDQLMALTASRQE